MKGRRVRMVTIKDEMFREEDLTVIGEICQKMLNEEFADGKYHWHIAHEHKPYSDIEFEVMNGDIFITNIK